MQDWKKKHIDPPPALSCFTHSHGLAHRHAQVHSWLPTYTHSSLKCGVSSKPNDLCPVLDSSSINYPHARSPSHTLINWACYRMTCTKALPFFFFFPFTCLGHHGIPHPWGRKWGEGDPEVTPCILLAPASLHLPASRCNDKTVLRCRPPFPGWRGEGEGLVKWVTPGGAHRREREK